jgi:hypothetical protein
MNDEQRYTATIYPGVNGAIDSRLAEIVQKLESDRGCPVWLLIQRGYGQSPLHHISQELHETFFLARRQLRVSETRPALVIDSGGGDANAAYQISTLLRRHCGGFTAIIPRYAKSAATLLALGQKRYFLVATLKLVLLTLRCMTPTQNVWAQR